MELPQQFQVVVGLIALTFLYSLLRIRKSTKRLEAPEPAGGLPIIGHFHLLRGPVPLHRMVSDMADKYGPVFTLRLGMYRTLVVSDQKVAKECFTTNDKVLASRPRSAVGKYLAYDYAMFGFAPYGSHWREMRKIAMNELLSNRRVEMLKHIQATEIDTFIKELHELHVKNQRNPITVDMDELFGDLAVNVIVKIVFGKRCFGNIAASDDEGEARNFRKALIRFLDLFGTFIPADSFPFLKWLDLGGHVREMNRTTKELDSIIVNWVEEHRRKRHSGESDGEHDFIDVMLSTLKDSQLSSYDTDTIIKAMCLVRVAKPKTTSQ